MNTALAKKVEEKYLKKTPELRPGDTVRVHQKIKEGNKERIQVFEGVVLKIKGGGIKTTILVRKISYGIGVEKSYLLHSPNIAKIEVKKRAKVRKAYLTYLRALQGKSARLREKGFDALAVNVADEPKEMPSSSEAKDLDSRPNDQKVGQASIKPASDDKVTDAEITELSEQEVAAVESEEVSLDAVEKAEEKKAKKEDQKGQDTADDDHQEAEKEEIKEGVEKAEEEEPKEKDSEGEKAEKNKEEKPESEVTEEIKEEKE